MSIKVEKLNWRDGVKDLQSLVTLTHAGRTKLDVGIATVPKGERFPKDGFTVADQSEVALIVDGAFELYSPEGATYAEAGDLVSFPAGQHQAYKPLADARLLYIHFGLNQD